ncbi:hypothetical protein [Agriterribacter sp.]|uniref:hypothetical protein n=1 Tax=Agriterribacter sp. TaxID=2821509 RepID=UPI002CAA5E39|nr:hypothetical protein [Agriterribacter sp.]HRO47679.1 hypothetical protein [Agriterribacter sp.]HRQ17660.1 hypothetical protein [Agriterribacter sp.]
MKIKEHCYKAAELLVKRFRSPVGLLRFLAESVTWTGYYEKYTKGKESHTFPIVYMMENHLETWISQMTADNQTILSKLAEVIDEWFNVFGSEGISEGAIHLLKCMACDAADRGVNEGYIIKWVKEIETLLDISAIAEECEKDRHKEKQAA